MTRFTSISVLLVFTILGFIPGCGSSSDFSLPSGEQGAPAVVPSRLEQAILGVAQERGIPAIALGLWRPGQQPLLVLYGRADLETERPPTANDSYRIGSVTKAFTVTVLLQLAEEGALSLDDPISMYLPEIQNGAATLEECAYMSSGIFNYTENQEFVLDLILNPTQVYAPEELIAAAEEFPPYFPPGVGWHYSNTNTVALGMVIEQVTGNSLQHEFARRILEPLGLQRTVYPDGITLPPPFASGYGLFEQGEPLEDLTLSSPSSSAGSGGMVSTLEDLAVFGQALAGGTLLQPASQERRLQMVTPDPEAGPEYDGYGLGIGELNGWLGHTGDYIGYQNLVMHDPESGHTVVIWTNLKDFTSSAHVPTDLFRDLVDLLGPEQEP